jgi:hypothetical protein
MSFGIHQRQACASSSDCSSCGEPSTSNLTEFQFSNLSRVFARELISKPSARLTAPSRLLGEQNLPKYRYHGERRDAGGLRKHSAPSSAYAAAPRTGQPVALDPTPQSIPEDAERFVKGVFVSSNGLPAREQFPKTVPFTEPRGRRGDADPLLLQHCCGTRHTPRVNHQGDSAYAVAAQNLRTESRIFVGGGGTLLHRGRRWN